MNKKIFLACFASIILSCNSSNYKYWDITKFNLSPGSLKDNSEIKLLYTSQRPPAGSGPECYIHLIAVSQENNDTFNILTTADNDLKKEDSSRIFAFFDENNLITKIDQLPIEDNLNGASLDSISSIKVTRLTKVARDPKFDNIADNKFPTVIGSIGLRTMPK